MNGRKIVEALKAKFKVRTNGELADMLGITTAAVQIWKNRANPTSRSLASLVFKAHQAGARRLQDKALRPLVEFFPVSKHESKQGAVYEIFGTSAEDGLPHPYRAGLRQELKNHTGIYIFFDSRGQAIYVGKARKQSLWPEIRSAFNRKRGAVQKIRRVNHPTQRQQYRNSDEKVRHIHQYEVALHELVAYFSAYDVEDGLIDEMEAMLVRSFANDLLNKNMERFGQQRRRKKK